MNIIMLLCLALIFIGGSTASLARGQVAPPPRFFGGNIGAWLGDGGSGPIFGFDDPWGIDFPFGSGGIGDPGFTGWIDAGEWTRGGGGPFSGGPGGNGYPIDSTFGCGNDCEEPSVVGPCEATCYCRRYTQGAYPEYETICDPKLWQEQFLNRMCRIKYGPCPEEQE